MFFKRFKWIDRVTCWIKTNWSQLILSKLALLRRQVLVLRHVLKQNGMFIFMGMEVIQSGGFKAETLLTKDFSAPNHIKTLSLMQLQVSSTQLRKWQFVA